MIKLLITESQLSKIVEDITADKVICDTCGWSWKKSEGGDDPYVCHKCGYNNSEDNEDYIGEKVMVYYNLHKHTFSIKNKEKVILHADSVTLTDVEFRVRQGGRENVLRDKSKNVHAFVIGTLADYSKFPSSDIPESTGGDLVTYNPYKYDSFVYKDDESPIYKAKEVHMVNPKKIFVVEK